VVACAGIGWDAHVVRELAARRRGHIRMRTWLGPIASAIRTYDFPRFRVTAADGRHAEGVIAFALNARPYAAFFRPLPETRTDDGLLDVAIVDRAGFLRLVRLAWNAWRSPRGIEGLPGVTVLRSPSFRVESERDVPWQADGDVGGRTPVDMLVEPAAVRFFRPRPS
jgi:diacylglycerol kinase family enzyme